MGGLGRGTPQRHREHRESYNQSTILASDVGFVLCVLCVSVVLFSPQRHKGHKELAKRNAPIRDMRWFYFHHKGTKDTEEQQKYSTIEFLW